MTTTRTHERHSPRSQGAAPSRCFTAHQLGRMRASAEIPEDKARRLVDHLGQGCARCWRALRRLDAFEIELGTNELPIGPTELEPSADPMVLALRTLGGWPPRRWLWPSHRAALDTLLEDAVLDDDPQPLAFLGLVLEEARCLARLVDDGVDELGPWLLYLEEVTQKGPEVAALLARALAYLAEAHVAAGDLRSAAAVLARADRRVEQRPAAEGLQALLTVTRARMSAGPHPQLAKAYLELAADRLVSSTDHALRAEFFLDLAAFHLDHAGIDPAWHALGRASKLLEGVDAPLLSTRLTRHRVCWCLLVAETVRPGLQRFAAHVRAFGHWAGRLDVPSALDAETWRQTERLADRMDGVWDESRPNALREALAWLDPEADVERFEIELRAVLAGTLVRLGEDHQAEAEMATLRQIFDRSPLLRPELDQARAVLADLPKQFPGVEPVAELVGPVVEVLERLREPVGRTSCEGTTA